MEWKIFASFLVVSTTSLLPYNLFMNAHEYFFYKLRNVTVDDTEWFDSPKGLHQRTPMQSEFEGYLTFFGGIACIIGAALNLLTTNCMSNGVRVVLGHVIVIAVFVPTICLTFVNTDYYQQWFFMVSLALASLASFGSLGILSGGVMGLAATYPRTCMQSVMIGQAVAGVISTVLSIVCQAFTSSYLLNGRIYFSIALVWTIFSVLVFIYLLKFTSKRDSMLDGSALDDAVVGLLDNDSITSDDIEVIPNSNSFKQYTSTISMAGPYLFAAFLSLFVTLSVFPAVASLVKSTSKNSLWNAYFSSLGCFLVFNVGDAAGRLIAGKVDITKKGLISLCMARILVVIVVCMCKVEPRIHTTALLPYDGVFVFAMLVFAVTNGFCLTISSVKVTNCVREDLREVAGSMVNLTCVIAALSGSTVGVLIVYFL